MVLLFVVIYVPPRHFTPCTLEARYELSNVPADQASYVKAQILDSCGGVLCSPFQGENSQFAMRSSNGDFKTALATVLGSLVDGKGPSPLQAAAAKMSTTWGGLKKDILTGSVLGPEILCKDSKCARKEGCAAYGGVAKLELASECARQKLYPGKFSGAKEVGYCLVCGGEGYK